MKKFLLIMLIAVLSCSTVFAEFSWTNEEYGYVLSAPFKKTSARVMAMGGAGIACAQCSVQKDKCKSHGHGRCRYCRPEQC